MNVGFIPRLLLSLSPDCVYGENLYAVLLKNRLSGSGHCCGGMSVQPHFVFFAAAFEKTQSASGRPRIACVQLSAAASGLCKRQKQGLKGSWTSLHSFSKKCSWKFALSGLNCSIMVLLQVCYEFSLHLSDFSLTCTWWKWRSIRSASLRHRFHIL